MSDLLQIIKSRQSSRVAFDPEKPVSKPDLEKILEAGRWAPTAHNMQNFEIVVIDDRKILDAIESLNGNISIDFIRENYRQLSFSESDLKEKKTGIMGNRFPRAWVSPELSDQELIEEVHKEQEHSNGWHSQFEQCSLLMLMLYDPSRRAPASEGDFLGIMSLGCIMENMWLMANSLGIAFHVVSSLSNPGIESQIKKILHIPMNLRIAISFRLGYTSKPARYLRVRRNISDFTHYNGYNERRVIYKKPLI